MGAAQNKEKPAVNKQAKKSSKSSAFIGVETDS